MKPSRETEKEAALQAAGNGRIDILKYFVEERKISDEVKIDCVAIAAKFGQLDCLKYLVEEAKVPLHHWEYIAFARLQRAHRLRKLLARKRVLQNQRTKNTLLLPRACERESLSRRTVSIEKFVRLYYEERERHTFFINFVHTQRETPQTKNLSTPPTKVPRTRTFSAERRRRDAKVVFLNIALVCDDPTMMSSFFVVVFFLVALRVGKSLLLFLLSRVKGMEKKTNVKTRRTSTPRRKEKRPRNLQSASRSRSVRTFWCRRRAQSRFR